VRIGINAQLLSTEPGYRQSGVSRYIERLLLTLPNVMDEKDELLVLRSRSFEGPGDDAPITEKVGDRVRKLFERPALRTGWEQTFLPAQAFRLGVDVLHGPVNVVPILATCPLVVTVHDLAYLRFPEVVPARRRQYFSKMTSLATRRADHVIAVSESTKADIVELLEVGPERITVTPLAADERFRPLSEDEKAAFRTTQKLTKPFILYLGNIEPRKNLPTLLRAFDRLAPQVEHDLVIVGGEGWMMKEFYATLAGMTHRDRVRIYGFAPVEDLPAWYNVAELFVFPSLYEGFGLPPLEAMACGTPVVTSNVSSLPEVVGDAALTVAPLDTDGLAEAMGRILGDEQLATALWSAGLERAATFTWNRTAARTITAYHSALA
jgi:glycosyltransferase involved in cell wall biosynthesis